MSDFDYFHKLSRDSSLSDSERQTHSKQAQTSLDIAMNNEASRYNHYCRLYGTPLAQTFKDQLFMKCNCTSDESSPVGRTEDSEDFISAELAADQSKTHAGSTTIGMPAQDSIFAEPAADQTTYPMVDSSHLVLNSTSEDTGISAYRSPTKVIHYFGGVTVSVYRVQ